MPTFRQDNKLGDSVPLIKTPDIGDKQVTERKLADGSVTSSKLSTEIANMLSLLTTRISAFKVADNLSSLPTEENTIGWLVDNHLYVYVGNGSTPESGMYQDCGELRGPQGIQGEQGLSGLNGKSAYDIWTEQPGNEDKSEIDFLEFTRGSKGDKGDQGERGYDISNIEQIVKSTEDGGKNIIRVTRSDGWSKVFEIFNGSKGSKGDKGTSIVKLEQTRKTTESSGLNTIEATLGDGTKESFEIYNGAKGEQGDKGEKGDKGDQGEIGPQGNSGIADASNKTLVNDAITGGETDFLSAEVGKLGILTYDCSKGGTVTHATLQDAINSVPTTFQKVGLTITYKSGDTIYRYTLKANAWSADPANWFSVEHKLSDLSKHAVFILSYSSKITITINSEENKIIVVLPKDLTIIGSNSIRYYINESVEIQRDKEDGNIFFVIFNTETKVFKIIRYNEVLEINDVFMFGMNVNIKQVTCNPNLVTFDAMPATKASDVYYDNHIGGKTINDAIDDLYKHNLSYLNLYKDSETLNLEKFIENHYVDFSGNIIQYNSYDVYKPVKLKKGQAINVECISAGISTISLSETENITEESVLTVVAKSTSYRFTQSFTYAATSDCFVVVSCKELIVAQIFNVSDESITQRAAYYEVNNKISNIGGAMYLGGSLPYIQGGKLHLGSTFCLCGVYFDGTDTIVPLKSHFDKYASKWRKMIFNPTTKVFDDLDYDKPIPSGYVTLGNYVTNAYGSNKFIDTLTNFDFNFIVKSLDADGNVINPTNAELKEMIDKVNDVNSIFYWNKPEVYDNIMLQATRPLLNDSNKYDFKPLVLCHFSDIHGDSINLKRILEFYNNYKKYFTDIIHTGDIVNDKFDDDFEFWKNTEGSNIILNCIGNHDSSRKEGDHYINDITSKQCFDKFFKEQIGNWNCVQPESAADLGLCYYYKDYSDSKIRLVVLDCMHYTDNQNSWFSQVLTEAKNKNYAVLVANHYQGGTMKCDKSCTFQSPLWVHADATINEKASETVDSFMNAGGDFIAWISGHTHRDLFGVLENYPNQTCISVDCGLCSDYWNDSFRRRGTKSQDCFNIMSINRSLNTFSIYRVGNNIDLQLRSKKCLVYNYATHKLISNY